MTRKKQDIPEPGENQLKLAAGPDNQGTTIHDSTIIDTPSGIARYRLLALRGALRLQSKGIQMNKGTSALTVVRREFGIKARTAEAALTEYEALLVERGILSKKAPIPKGTSCGKHYPGPCPASCFLKGDRFSKNQIEEQGDENCLTPHGAGDMKCVLGKGHTGEHESRMSIPWTEKPALEGKRKGMVECPKCGGFGAETMTGDRVCSTCEGDGSLEDKVNSKIKATVEHLESRMTGCERHDFALPGEKRGTCRKCKLQLCTKKGWDQDSRVACNLLKGHSGDHRNTYSK